MKKLIFIAAVTVVAARTIAGDVGVSIAVNQPGLYGQINIGDMPQAPQLIYAQPVVVQQDVRFAAEPIYLHVPPGHAKHWRHHCAQYNACGRPVYFVRDDWYSREYVPHYRSRDTDHREDEGHGHGGEQGRGHEHEHEHEHDD